MSDAEWIDITIMGSPYEEQINKRTGEARHRLIDFPRPRLGGRDFGAAESNRPWTPGRPPQ
jgi:hypothetical protein